jgi:hypothetical protein
MNKEESFSHREKGGQFSVFGSPRTIHIYPISIAP